MFHMPFKGMARYDDGPNPETAHEKNQSTSDQTMTDAPPVSIKKESGAIDQERVTPADNEIPVVPRVQEEDTKGASDRVQAAKDTKNRLSADASKAQKSMLRMQSEFTKFHDILLQIQQTEHKNSVHLNEIESVVLSQQIRIRHHTDHMSATEDHEDDCKAIDEASAKIRELQAKKADVRAKLKQSEADRKELEALLSSHHNAVSQAVADVQDWSQEPREAKRHKVKNLKRNASGSFAYPNDGTDDLASSSDTGHPAVPLTSGGNDSGGTIPGPRDPYYLKLVQAADSSNVVPSTPRLSSRSLLGRLGNDMA